MAAIQPTRQAHLLGICGSGMRALADYLSDSGWQVSGCDPSLSPAVRQAFDGKGIQVDDTHSVRHISAVLNLVVHSLAVPSDHPELLAAKRLGIQVQSYVEFLADQTKSRPTLGIAGTHGKTTTSCVLAHLMQSAGNHPGVLCGGRLQGQSAFGTAGEDEWLIAECCEFRQSFLKMRPLRAALLSVEPDHFDCYPEENALCAAFGQFCETIPAEGSLVVNADSPLAVRCAARATCRTEYFSVSQTRLREVSAEKMWLADSIRLDEQGVSFTLRQPAAEPESTAQSAVNFVLPCYGKHQIVNAIAAILVARQSGITDEALKAGLRSFPGVERRFHDRGTYQGLCLIDDYAHHPTEIIATIQAARQKHPRSHLTVAFQPHQILRTQQLMHQFAAALATADRVCVLPIFAARERADDRCVQVSEQLVQQTRQLGCEIEFCPSLDHFRSKLDDIGLTTADAGSHTVLTLGAGDIDRIFHGLPHSIC